MALLSIRGVSIGFGGPCVLDQINLLIEQGERVGLLGRNGSGKSTLMRLISRELLPDEGDIQYRRGVKIAFLQQEVPQRLNGKIFDVIAKEVGKQRESCDTEEEWKVLPQIDQMISRMKLDPDADFASLSAGLKRRVMIAGCLAGNPDILLLDEPTNHLDIEAMHWLEEFLLRHAQTLIFVTHDRFFLQRLSTRIVELDRGNLASWCCDYQTFLKRKELEIESETSRQIIFDKKLSREEFWIRQGIKARRTRNKGRIKALQQMRAQRFARRECTGRVRMQLQHSEISGKLVIDAQGITYAYQDDLYINNFSTTIMRGDKVGIIGYNGSGKSTLLQILLGELYPDQGTVRHGTQLKTAYFDQLRYQLDEQKTLQENVADSSHIIDINGKQRHIVSYLQDFLFTPEKSRSPVRYLSGGERNRLMLAKLFAMPSNFLILDEPTNDLDVETVELLEEVLLNYQGTLLLVSHDRMFINNVVTSTLVFEGKGKISEYVGNYDDWLSQAEPVTLNNAENNVGKIEKTKLKPKRSDKLSYNEQRELETLPQRIENLETQQRQLYQMMADPAFYQSNSGRIANTKVQLAALENELKDAYQRWETLEEKLQ
ncbi:MAG: ATP-binding cassette domain-containing protein [Desulfobacterales bacterium]|nr:ATP-binding cassette domain-containing protein [Desulfobacterales bacterium]